MNSRNIILFLMLLVIILGTFVLITNPTLTIQKERISNVFIDMNGDGMTDFVVDANVILNNGQQNFPYQPTNSQP